MNTSSLGTAQKNLIVLLAIVFLAILLGPMIGSMIIPRQEYIKDETAIYLHSDHVEFAEAAFVKQMNRMGETEKAIAEFRYHNILDRKINVNTTAVFYDKNDNALFSSYFQVYYFYEDYTEKTINQIIYDGPDASKATYVVLSTTELPDPQSNS